MSTLVTSILPPVASTLAANAAPVPPSRAEGAPATQPVNANNLSAGQAGARQAAVVVSLGQAASFRSPTSGSSKQVDASFEKQAGKGNAKKDDSGIKGEGRKGRVNVTV